jgi:glycosyltransferase involved in cell wall biosynthesis
MSDPLYFQWGISALFGWGVYGLNLLRYWPEAAGSKAYCIGQISLESLRGMDPLALHVLAQPLVDSDQMRIRVDAVKDVAVALDGIVLHSLGNQFNGPVLPRNGGVTGSLTGGVIFFENTDLPNAADIAGDYDVIVTGSTWCEQVLRERSIDHVATVIQGIDPSLFHPAPRAGHLDGRFAVFSGGKLEHRKGQDLVVLAFKAFAARHPEAILVTAWHSPWASPALTLNANPAIAPIALTAEGGIDMGGWAAANGIDPSQYFDLGAIPNHQMAKVLREMDVALFPNRCEGGTNLVAMECIACGIPAIVADNTGQKDLTAIDGIIPLTRQGAVTLEGTGTEGWGESDVEEMVEALEAVWRDREAARRRALTAAAAMAGFGWRNQIRQLAETLNGWPRR